MIIQWLILLPMLNGVEIGRSKYALTSQENDKRLEECGKFPLNKTEKLSPYVRIVGAISQKHVVISSNAVLIFKNRYEWKHNRSVFDREAYCKSGMKYLEVPTDAMQTVGKIYPYSALQGYILGICDYRAPGYPMIVAISGTLNSFACIADKTTKIPETVYAFGSIYVSRSGLFRVTVPARVVKISEYTIDLKLDMVIFHTSIVTDVGGRVTTIGYHGYEEIGKNTAARIPFDTLCSLFGICNQKSPTTRLFPFNSNKRNVMDNSELDDLGYQKISKERKKETGGI